MKMVIMTLIFVIIPLLAVAQSNQDSDIMMGNIELLNNKISGLSGQINSLKSKLKNVDSKIAVANQDISVLDANIRKGFNDLEDELQRINVDYKATLKQIEFFRDENAIQEEEITSINNKLLSLSNDLFQLAETLSRVNKVVNRIPELYSNPDAVPMFGVNLALVKFVTFGLSDVNVEPVYTIGASYRLDKDLNVWGEFSSPFVLSLSRQSPNSGRISDKWNAQLYSLGIEKQIKIKNMPDLNFSVSGGLFLAAVSYDKYANSTVNVDRSQADGISTIGANAKVGLSYNQFRLKNPLELYFHFNNLISINNIVLSTDPQNKFDLGAYLFSITFGIKFHFW